MKYDIIFADNMRELIDEMNKKIASTTFWKPYGELIIHKGWFYQVVISDI